MKTGYVSHPWEEGGLNQDTFSSILLKSSFLPDKVNIKFNNSISAHDNSINGVLLTYLALDCFHSIGIEALLAFATELLEVHLKKKRQVLLV